MIDRYVLVIGAMKAGTTSLFDHLSRHPEVAPSRRKEPQYFAEDERYGKGPESYEALWDWDPSRHRVALEASTRYSIRGQFPHTVERIASHPGEFRFVYLVRNPLDRVVSHYQHALAAGWPVADRPLVHPLHPNLVEPCRYAWQLDAYAERFGREAILVRPFEQLVEDPRGLTADALTHAGLDPALVEVEAGRARNQSSEKVVSERVHSIRRLPFAKQVAQLLPQRVRGRVKEILASGTEKPTLPADAAEALVVELAPDLRRLRDEWGIDVGRWRLGI